MPDWATIDNAVIVGLLSLTGVLVGHFFNRQGRREEVSASESDSLLQRQGDQIERLVDDQRWMRKRLDRLEQELWAEREHGQTVVRFLVVHVEWGEDMVRWLRGDRSAPYPSPPDFVAARKLLDSPRPRRPPMSGAT